MSTKWTIIISVLWVVFVMAACLGIGFYMTETRAWPRSQANERMEAMAQPAAIFTCITLLPLWIYWGTKRRQALGR